MVWLSQMKEHEGRERIRVQRLQEYSYDDDLNIGLECTVKISCLPQAKRSYNHFVTVISIRQSARQKTIILQDSDHTCQD